MLGSLVAPQLTPLDLGEGAPSCKPGDHEPEAYLFLGLLLTFLQATYNAIWEQNPGL